MIKIGRICDMKDNQESVDEGENWMIVRSPDEILPYARLVPQLSPSEKLFRTYRKAYNEGKYDQSFFDEIYVPWFLRDLAENREALDLLDMLCRESQNRNFFLACYCENESMCHRSIVAGVLSGMGAAIDTDHSYDKYGTMLQEILKNSNS